jgi:hypothetical protein
LHPRSPRVVFALPRLSLRFVTRFRDGSREEHRARLVTVTINTDHQTISLLHLSELPCHPKVHQLLETQVSLRQWLKQRSTDVSWP